MTSCELAEIETLRILHVAWSVDPNCGGPSNVIRNIVREQVRQGHDVTLLATAIQVVQSRKDPAAYKRDILAEPAFAGAEGSLGSLASAIGQNIGSLLMSYGMMLGPAGLPFVAAGAAIQMGVGVARGFSGAQTESGTAVSYTMSGQNLVGTTTRYNTYKNVVT